MTIKAGLELVEVHSEVTQVHINSLGRPLYVLQQHHLAPIVHVGIRHASSSSLSTAQTTSMSEQTGCLIHSMITTTTSFNLSTSLRRSTISTSRTRWTSLLPKTISYLTALYHGSPTRRRLPSMHFCVCSQARTPTAALPLLVSLSSS